MRSTRRGSTSAMTSSSGMSTIICTPGVLGQVPDVAQRAVHRGPQIDCLDRQFGDTGVVAGDFQQIAEQRLEPVQLVDHQLGGPLQRGVEILAVVVDQVSGHPHRGQRGTQFVADVRGEAALQVTELLELGDLSRQAFGHIVERHRQPRHVVLAADRNPFGQMAVGESLGGPRRRAHWDHHLTGDHPGDPGQQHHQHHTAGGHGSANQRDRALLVAQREHQVQLEIVHPRHGRGADDQRRPREAVGVHRRVLIGNLAGLHEFP